MVFRELNIVRTDHADVHKPADLSTMAMECSTK